MSRIFVGFCLLLFWVGCSQPQNEVITTTTVPDPTPTSPPTPTPAAAPPGELFVNAHISRGEINPLVYGTNTGPWAGLPLGAVEDYQDSGLTFIRYPGGNWGDENILRPYQVDQFMDMAAMIEAEVLIHVNLLTGTPEEAVELLRYTNEEKGVGVRYWSIGNESNLYNHKPHITGWDADFFNERWREFAQAMKAQDPDILLVGPDVNQYTAVEANNPKDDQGRDWMREFLRANGDLVDIVSIHRYPFGESNPTIEDLRQNSPEWDETIPYLRQVIREETGRDLPVSVMEVNSNWSNTLGGEATPDSFYNAIWWADALGRIINQGVAMVAHWMLFHPRDGTGILTRDEPRPTYYVYSLYQQFGNEKLHADSSVNDLSIVAARRDEDTITLMIVNRGPDEVAVPLQVDGFAGAISELWRFDVDHQAENFGPIEWTNGEALTLPGQSISLLVLSE